MNAVLIRKLAIGGGLLALIVWLEMRRKKPAPEGKIEAVSAECIDDPTNTGDDQHYVDAACRRQGPNATYGTAFALGGAADSISAAAALGIDRIANLFD